MHKEQLSSVFIADQVGSWIISTGYTICITAIENDREKERDRKRENCLINVKFKKSSC